MTSIKQTNFIDVIENSIGRPLSKNDLIKNPLEFKEIETLGVAINVFKNGYKLPKKNDTDLRPSISPRLKLTDNLGFNYVSRIHEFPQYEGLFTSEIKKYLLYCHGLVIEDPLSYLLDYFRPGCKDSPYAQARVPVINSLLIEYSGISELIKSGIVFPVSEPFYYENEVPHPDKSLLEELSQRLVKNQHHLSQLTDFIFLEQFRKQKFDNYVDSFYPDLEYISVLNEIMKIRNEKFTHKSIVTPFGASVIGSISLLNLEKISIEDICHMRKQEDLFFEWREFLNHTFETMYDHSSTFTDLDNEFLNVSKNKFHYLENKTNARLTRTFSNISLKNTGKTISIGAISGAFSGMISGDVKSALLMGLFTGMLSGGVQSGVGELIDILNKKKHKKEKSVIRNHFLAINLPK